MYVVAKRPAPAQIAVGGRTQKLMDSLRRGSRVQYCLQGINRAGLADIESFTLRMFCIAGRGIRWPVYKAMAALRGRFSITTRTSPGVIATLLGGDLGAAGGARSLYSWIFRHPIYDLFHPVPNLPEVRLIRDTANI